MARLATFKAKPNGSFLVEESHIESFMSNIPVDQLPGIGWSYQEKLQNKKIWTCGDLRSQSLHDLQLELGMKTGEMLYKFSRGIDDRKLENRARQSLGVDINWGVRFQNQSQISDFFKKLTDYVSDRLKDTQLKASHITVKAKKRLYKGEPTKFLGCGHCDNLSKSKAMPFSNDSQKLFDIGYSLFLQLSVNPIDVRGIGISVKNFDQDSSGCACSPVKKLHGRQETIIKYLSPIKAGPSKTYPLLQLEKVDPGVLKELPSEIQQEIRNMLQKKDIFTTPQPKLKGSKKKLQECDFSKNQISHLDDLSPELMSNPGKYQTSDILSLPSDYDPSVFKALPSSIQRELRVERQKMKLQSKKELSLDNLMPSSSQIDQAVLIELPESIRKEILEKKYIRSNRSQDLPFMSRMRGAQREIQSMTSDKLDILLVSKTGYPDLGGEKDPLAIYEMLTEWVYTTTNPQYEALEELIKYLSDLANVGDLSRIRNVFLCIKRIIKVKYGDTNTVWSNAIFQVFTVIGQIIYQKYGAQLKM